MNKVKKTDFDLEKNIVINKILKLDKNPKFEKYLLKMDGYLECLGDIQKIGHN